MSYVLQFLPRQADHVVIDAAHVMETVVHSCRGDKRFTHEPPKLMYFVTLYEASGGQINLWSGPCCANAREAAREASVDWSNCAIVDLIREVPA